MSSTLLKAVRVGLAELRDPIKASSAQAYMKSSMPYYGVAAPKQRSVYSKVFADHPLETFEEWEETVLELWRTAKFREERYAAIELTGHKLYRPYQTLEALPIYEEMITDGAWWDYVDAVAVQRIGKLLLPLYRNPITTTMKLWSVDPHLWKRRSSIICQVGQVGLKGDTDLKLLYHCIENNVDDRDFFIRKAIGWALRAYAWIDAKEITDYVAAHPALSPLSKREALRNTLRNPQPEGQT
ncbi:MAG: DNA alkylation repair protein [Actinomycetota bacterium]